MKLKSRPVRLGLIQTFAGADPADNLRNQIKLIRQAARRKAQMICTQELFRSPYFCQEENHDYFGLAEAVPDGPSTRALCRVAKECGVVIIGSLFERRAPGLYYNTAVVIDADGRYLGSYRKMHIPDDPLFYEKFYFTPGDLGFRAWNTQFGRIGVLICWDQWYPEAARLTAMEGAEILFYPTAIGWQPAEKAEYGVAQHDAWRTIQRSHGVANGCYVASVNRVGHERLPKARTAPGADGIEFWGQSFVSDPSGQVMAEAAADQEEILVVSVDLGRVEFSRMHWPFFRDRRIDAYDGIRQRFGRGEVS